jgi:biopolymer transport protein ExbD
MRHRRTWITRHREDQKNITCLCIHMAMLLSFHYAMRVLVIFSIVTLRESTRLSTVNENFPYEALNGVVFISCLMLACSLAHLAGAIKRRWAIKLIATSLVVASCCLIANSTILRSILKSNDPRVITNLDPQTVIIDVDRRGWVSHDNYLLDKSTMQKLLESRLRTRSSTPVIICADRRAFCRDVWSVVETCHESGATDISLARQYGFDRYNAPVLNETSIPSNIPTNMVTSVEVGRSCFVLNGKPSMRRDMTGVMSDYVKRRTENWYSIDVAGDALYENVLVLLHVFQDSGATNLVWETLR